jgi:hypothetical protein
MQIKFLKRRYYKGKLYEVGEIINISAKDGRAYTNMGSAKMVPPAKKTLKPIKKEDYVKVKVVTQGLDNLSYKELVELAKENNIPARGKKEELKRILKETGDF